MTLGTYAVDWLRDTALTVRPTTTDFYRHALRHLEPIAGVPVDAVTPAHVRGLIATASERGLSGRTTRGIVQTLSQVLRRAEQDGIVERNVAALVRLPKLETKEPRRFTVEQARRFLEVTRDDELGGLYATALGTGLRRGELLGLTWRDVDLVRGTANVRRSKTGAGVRTVPLPTFAVAALAPMERRPGAIWPVDPSWVSELFKRACERAGLPYITLHGLRHTAATLMLESGVDPLTLRALMGHTKISMTGHYARAGDELRRDAAERLSGTIGGTREGSG